MWGSKPTHHINPDDYSRICTVGDLPCMPPKKIRGGRCMGSLLAHPPPKQRLTKGACGAYHKRRSLSDARRLRHDMVAGHDVVRSIRWRGGWNVCLALMHVSIHIIEWDGVWGEFVWCCWKHSWGKAVGLHVGHVMQAEVLLRPIILDCGVCSSKKQKLVNWSSKPCVTLLCNTSKLASSLFHILLNQLQHDATTVNTIHRTIRFCKLHSSSFLNS